MWSSTSTWTTWANVRNHDVTAALRALGISPHKRDRLHVQLGYVLLRPGVQAVVLHRLAHRLANSRANLLSHVVAALSYRLTGAEIDPRARIGPEFVIYHPAGVVVHRDVTTGARLRIYSSVVIGNRPGRGRHGAPRLGDRVTIGTGAKILGTLQVGDGAMVGANAVVINDVPAGHRAVGVPAISRPGRYRQDVPEGLKHPS